MILAPATDDTATIQVDCQMATRRLAAPQGRVAASPLGAVGAKPIREHVSECEANDQNDCNFQHWESRQHRRLRLLHPHKRAEMGIEQTRLSGKRLKGKATLPDDCAARVTS